MCVCEKHRSAPAIIYGGCAGCEIEGLRARVAELEAKLLEVWSERSLTTEAERDRYRAALDRLREVVDHPHLNSLEKLATIANILTQA